METRIPLGSSEMRPMNSPRKSEDSGPAASAGLNSPIRLLVLGMMLGFLWAGQAVRAQETAPATSPVETLNLSDQKAVKDRGDLFMVRKFFPEAVGMYRRLTELDPKNPVYQNLLGIAYHQMQNFDDAKKAYRAALRLNPKYPEATNNLAAVEYAQKNYRAAILTYFKALELSPGDAVIYSNLGTAYFAYKRFDYAMDCYRYALLRDPTIFERSGRTGSIVHQRDVQDVAGFNFYLAKTYAGLNDIENTLLYLSKAWESGFADLRKSLNDKAFAFLAKEPRFVEFVAQLDREEQQKAAPGESAPASR